MKRAFCRRTTRFTVEWQIKCTAGCCWCCTAVKCFQLRVPARATVPGALDCRTGAFLYFIRLSRAVHARLPDGVSGNFGEREHEIPFRFVCHMLGVFSSRLAAKTRENTYERERSRGINTSVSPGSRLNADPGELAAFYVTVAVTRLLIGRLGARIAGVCFLWRWA